MLPKRAGEHLHSENNTTEKWPKLTDEEVINVEDDFENVAQSTMKRLKDHVTAGDQDAIRQLLEQQHVKLKTPEGGDLLWTAYNLNQIEIAAMLVRHGADLLVRKSPNNRTLLHHMLMGRGIESIATRELFKLMLVHQVDIEARDSERNSLLNCAIASSFQGTTELAEELLERGAQLTIDEENWKRDDIRLACKHKWELLKKLIRHRNCCVEMRNQRASIAVKGLITENYTGHKGTQALLLIKNILDLGVPVDVPSLPHAQRCRQKISFLDTAFSVKNIPAIQFLLRYGADPRQRDPLGQTTLYRATAFKEDTEVTRLLIEEGVSIRIRNDLGDYPIHGACTNESLKNVHLLLNLGSNLRAVNKSEVTPFGAMNMDNEEGQKDVHRLVIKHLALMVARGEKVNRKDLDKINQFVWSKTYFETCTTQLARMKVEKVNSDVFYFSILSKNMYSTLQLVENQSFVESFKRERSNRKKIFSEYYNIITDAFELAEMRLAVLAPETEELRKVFNGSLPDSIVEKIAYYMCFVELKDCRRKYFMDFHVKMTNPEAYIRCLERLR